MMFDSGPSLMPFVKSGKLRALAATTANRINSAPELRTMIEAGYPGFVHSNWYGIWGPDLNFYRRRVIRDRVSVLTPPLASCPFQGRLCGHPLPSAAR
jgi:hypothetical protein